MVVAACGGDGSQSDGLAVFAAASLTDAFTEIGEAFEAIEPGTDVRFNFAGSSSLREQILSGAPADVFASADVRNMVELGDADLIDGPSIDFATNRLTIAVPAGNPADVSGLVDFARDELLLGLCAIEVPCGTYAADILGAAGVDAAPDTLEPDVRALLTKVAAGDLDAGIVYETDVHESNQIETVPIDRQDGVVISYPIALLTGADDRDLARRFIDFVLRGEGAVILREHGFGPA